MHHSVRGFCLPGIIVIAVFSHSMAGTPTTTPTTIPTAEPKPEEFVTIQDGHLHRHGKRMRYWATNLLFVGDKYHKERLSTNYESIYAGIERLKKFGYNAVRYWVCAAGDFENYKKGDRSVADYSDYFIARLKEEGFVVWRAGLNFRPLDIVTAKDVMVIDDPATEKEWIEAISETPQSVTKYRARAWDPRLCKLNLRQVKKYLDHYNQYTKLHAYEDPVYAVWELTNEEWWTANMLRGAWTEEPEFFRRELIQQWNDWLKKKYKTTEALRKAWDGLLKGESLEKGTVAFAPMDVAVEEKFAGRAISHHDDDKTETLTKKQFSHARYKDVKTFLLELCAAYKKEIEVFIRSCGKEGIGCQIVPIVWDTGIDSLRNVHPSLDLYSRSSASVFGFYFKEHNPDQKDSRFPWKSIVTDMPPLLYSSSWVERNRVENKPLLIYELNIFNPSKYRADMPYMFAALGSMHDWDWISWYQFDGFRRVDKDGDPNPYDRPMNYEYDAHYWNGVYYIFDKVLQASMMGAGEIFKTFAARPKKIGAHLADKGPVYTPTDQITIDAKTGYLQFDTPGAKAVGGFLPKEWKFSDDVTLDDIHVHLPDGQSFVIPGECFAIIYLVAMDAKPLDESKRILLTAMSTSFREGFSINADAVTSKKTEGNWWGAPRKEVFRHTEIGKRPRKNLVSRVGLKIRSRCLKGKTWNMYDWHQKEIDSGKVAGEEFILPTDKDAMFVIFEAN